MNRHLQSLLLASLLAGAGCASVRGTQDAPLDQGEYRIFAAGVDETRQAAYNALLGTGLRVDEVDRVEPDTWMLVAIREGGEWTWGEIVRVVVSPEDESHTRVTVLTRRRVGLNLTAKGDYSDEMFDQIAFQIGAPVNVPTDGCRIRGAWKPADCPGPNP